MSILTNAIADVFPSFIDVNSSLIVGDSSSFGNNIQKMLQNIVGPIALIIIGIIAITFLVQRQIMQMVIFLIIGVVVAALIYVPNMIKGLGEGAGGEISW